jgi:predicted metal-dependent hydrolase
VAETVIQGGRAKAYRPLSEAARRAAFEAGLAAYRRGDFFEAHELLEPAWMGTADPTERALHQGLIKLAAGYVHALRGNPEGMTKNLRGSREWLAAVVAAGTPVIARSDVDVAALVAAIEFRLEALHRTGTIGPIDPPSLTGGHVA